MNTIGYLPESALINNNWYKSYPQKTILILFVFFLLVFRLKEYRFVPVHPKIADLLKSRKKTNGILLPAINERKLLKRLKILCAEEKFDNPGQYKLHSFRHHFASLCANHQVAYRKALAWLGHSSSEMLDLYYHLHDEDSHNTMMELAGEKKTNFVSDPNKGNFRATAQSKIVKNTQHPELQELMSFIFEENKKPERAGFEPAVRKTAHWFSKPAPSATRTPLHII